MGYDSSVDTNLHIDAVAKYLMFGIVELHHRIKNHDKSKLEAPEKEIYDIYTPKLKTSTYGSDEYKQFLLEMGEGLKHHYLNNWHHPEHYHNGIDGMNIFNLFEMLCDWKAATERHSNGDINKSINIVNKARFNMSEQLINIFNNTARDMGWI